MEDCEENQKKEGKDERKDFDARWEQPPFISLGHEKLR